MHGRGAHDADGDGGSVENRTVDISEEARARLSRHLTNWLGDWPDPATTIAGVVIVTSSSYREIPGWDGQLRAVVGVSTPNVTVMSVAKRYRDAVQDAVDVGGLHELDGRLSEIIGHPGASLRSGVFRYQQLLVPHESRGVWLRTDDPLVPEWLRVFNADVLVAFDDRGHYAAGVGRKLHDGFGQELAITTEESHRRQGYARELVAQAAERVYDEGAIATYLHRRDNLASAAVADAAGFFDLGWEVLSLAAPGV